MKKILLSFLLAGVALGLKAQTLNLYSPFNKPQKNNTSTNNFSDSLLKKYSFQPNQKVFITQYTDNMPVAKVQSNDNMPIIKLHSNDKMPGSYSPDNNSLINKTKPTLRP